jgi:predicted HTH transcriptional regulator
MFNLINVGDRAGSGIPNIYDIWQKEGWERPVLEEQFNPDRTILSLVLSQANNKKVAIKSCDKEKVAISDVKKQEIIDYLTANQVAKASKLAELLGVTPARVRVLLSQLVEAGIVIAEGGNRNRTYRLKL